MSDQTIDKGTLPRAVIEENESTLENNRPVEPHSPSMDRSDILSNNDTCNDGSDERCKDRRVDSCDDGTYIPDTNNYQFDSNEGNSNANREYRNSGPTHVSDKKYHVHGDDSFMNRGPTDKNNKPVDCADKSEIHIEVSKSRAIDTTDAGENTETSRKTDTNMQSSGEGNSEGLQITENCDNQNDDGLQTSTAGYTANQFENDKIMKSDESVYSSSEHNATGIQTTEIINSQNEEKLDQNDKATIYTESHGESEEDIQSKLALEKLREISAKTSYDDDNSPESQDEATAPAGAELNVDDPDVRDKSDSACLDSSWDVLDSEQYRHERKMKREAEEKYEYFWKKYDIYSQWHPSDFKLDDKTFNCAEQYMMFKKATLFEDYKIGNKILKSKNPPEMKRLGRKVNGFSEDMWSYHCLHIVKAASKAKFLQNDELKKTFLNTFPKILVESSPMDKIWGIGLHKDDAAAWNEETWCGKNYLGYILTEVRDEILVEEGHIESKDRKVYIEKLMENVKGSSSVDKGPVKNKNAEPKRTESSTSPSDATASTPDFDKEEITNASAIGDSVHSPLKVEEEGVDAAGVTLSKTE